MPILMEDRQAIEVARRGERVDTNYSYHKAEKETAICYGAKSHFYHHWRTIACDGETDVVECSDCGRQAVCACNFDEQYD